MRTLTHYLRDIAHFGLGQSNRTAIEFRGAGVRAFTPRPSGETERYGRDATVRLGGTTACGHPCGVHATDRWQWASDALAGHAMESVAKRRA